MVNLNNMKLLPRITETRLNTWREEMNRIQNMSNLEFLHYLRDKSNENNIINDNLVFHYDYTDNSKILVAERGNFNNRYIIEIDPITSKDFSVIYERIGNQYRILK